MTTPSQTETARPLDGAMEHILDDGQRPGWWRHFAGHEDTECVIRPMHLASLLDRAARTHGNRLAIRFQNFQMTYSRLHEAAERFAEALRLRGVKPGQRVAVMLPNIPQTVIAFWGIMKAGAVAVMTNPLYMEKELLHHFNDAGAEVLVTLDLLWAKLEPLRDRLPLRLTVVTNISDGLAFPLNWLYRIKARRQGQVPQVPYGQEVLRWKDFIKVRGRFSVPTDEDPGDALALLQYTGGTSGQPKGAMLGHACISAQMQQLLAILHMDWENCKPMSFLSIMPFFHVFGLVGNIILPTALAATTIPVPRYTPADLLRTIARFRPTFFVGAPSVYMSLMQQKDIKKYDLTCIEICVSGSAPFPTEALRRWVSMTHASITEGFGLTEASPCVTANPLDGPQKEGSIGVAFPHTEIRIVDINDSNHVLGPNEEGEMLVRGPQVMQGYWHLPDETASALRNGWLYTGDRFYYMKEDGTMATGWEKVGDEWYYFHEDGGMNEGQLVLDNAVYEFESSGALKTAKWLENTGGGAYNAGCYDDITQELFSELGDEKKEQYFDAYPDREREYDGDNHTSYDRYAGFIMDMKLNKIAQSRLEAAMEKGYADGRVTGEGTIEDTLASIPYRKNASCLEVYVRDCEDTDEAYDKIMNVTGRKYTSKSDRKYTLQYYRYMGMAHEEKNGHHWFMVLFMR